MLYTGIEYILNYDLQRGFGCAIPVNQALQWQCTLTWRSSRNDSFLDLHGVNNGIETQT